MSIKEDINAVQNKVRVLEKETLATEIYKDYKIANKRLFTIIIVILIMWFATIGGFVYYISTTGMEEIKETVDIDNEDGEAKGCIGDNCNAGVLNGESKTN